MSLTKPAPSGVIPGPDFTNGPEIPPRFPTVTAAILHHVLAIPAEVAVIDHTTPEPRTMTYEQLGSRAAHLAQHLRTIGVLPGDRIPLVARRGVEMTVGIVAILACGAQYVPLDGKVVPRDTLRRVVEQSGGKVAVCMEETVHRMAELAIEGCTSVVVEEHMRDVPAVDYRQYIEEELMKLTTEDSGCYVIYTSGTTGAPKGVDVTQGNVANLVCTDPGSLGIRPGIRVSQVLSISFDMAAWEVLGCLSNGGTLVSRGSDWVKAISQVEVLICTPSILSKFHPEDFPNLQTVATAGEPISVQMADLWASYLTYYNCCGPTETTIVNTMQKHTSGQPLSIGGPTVNNRVYILDEDLNQVPIGTTGMVWGGGKGISRGYVNLPELTSEKYITDKFSNDGTMMYNTGDIGSWLPDGTVQIQGRCDDQVKVKGFRVELDGIAACLCSAPGVSKAVVLHIDNQLHGFLQSLSCDVSAVKEHTKALLPYYALPAVYHVNESFPLTPNGKVDKRALKAMAESPVSSPSDSGTDEPSSNRGYHRQTASTSTTATDMPPTIPRAVHSRMTSCSTVATYVDPTMPKAFHRPMASTSTSASTIAFGREMAVYEDPILEKDLEKQTGHQPKASTSTSASSNSSINLKKEMAAYEAPVPGKDLPQPFRGLIYRVFIPYRFLFSLVWISNIAAAIGVYINGPDREWLGTMVAINLALAVLIRQDFVINAVYTVTCSVPKSWPLWIRASTAKIYHLGGVHSSAASCAALWLMAANSTDAACLSLGTCANYPPRSIAYAVLSWMLVVMFIAMMVFAYPTFRKAKHNFFERFHRFVGWSMLAIFWAQTLVSVGDNAKLKGTSYGMELLPTPAFWLLAVATGSVAMSWFFLRRVPVVSEVLSDHAVRLHFGYTVPVNGSFARLSFRPLIEWHSFATIPAPKPHGPPEDPERYPAGYSLIVSNAGDWTKWCINNPPRSLWVRGVPTCGVMRIATLFRRVVVIATGSGIGPCLGHIQDPSCPTQVLWSTRDPEKTFGPGVIGAIKDKVPDAVIWDTSKLGRPDMVRLGYNLATEFGAEAVVVISNEKITKKIVYGLETRGIPAYGAIFDS